MTWEAQITFGKTKTFQGYKESERLHNSRVWGAGRRKERRRPERDLADGPSSPCYPDLSTAHWSLKRDAGGKENKGVPNGGEIYRSPKCSKSRCLFTLVVAIVLSCHKVAMSKTTFALIKKKKKKNAFGVQF